MKIFNRLFVLCTVLAASGIALAGITIEDGLTEEMTLQPGVKAEGKITIRNDSDSPQQVRAYQTDYIFRANGSNEYGDPGSAARSNAGWIAFAPKQFTVPAHDRYSIYYAVQAPNDKKLSGTYWSMLMIEPADDNGSRPVETEKGKFALGLQTVMRYGIQIVTHVGTDAKAELRIADRKVIAGDKSQTFRLDIENVGERWARPVLHADIYDGQGAYLGRFEGSRSRIYPGCSVRQEIGLGKLPAGNYNALIILDDGDESAWGAQYEIEIK
jgi:hypothetical protein